MFLSPCSGKYSNHEVHRHCYTPNNSEAKPEVFQKLPFRDTIVWLQVAELCSCFMYQTIMKLLHLLSSSRS